MREEPSGSAGIEQRLSEAPHEAIATWPERSLDRPEPPDQATTPIPLALSDSLVAALPVAEPRASRLRFVVRNWPVLIPLALFAIAAMVVPTMTNIATTDDWGYTRSVEILLDEGHLRVFPVVAATAVGQILWGALFGLIFGMTLGVMRLSTVVMVALGSVALYAILRQLGIGRGRSTAGMALYLFNPLGFILAFTFMTDPHFVSVLLISLALYMHGLRLGREIGWVIVLASIVAGYAFLIRQQGALIPLSVVLWLIVSRRLPLSRSGIRRALHVALAPALMVLGYYLWLRFFNDVPNVQEGFLREVIDAGWPGTWLLLQRLPFYVVMYLGVFLIPVVIALLPGFRERLQGRFFESPLGYWLFLGFTGVALTMFFVMTAKGGLMPFMPQFVGPSGFGPPDVQGSRRRIVGEGMLLEALTITAILGAILIGLLVLRHVAGGRQVLRPRRPAVGTPENHAAGLVAMVAAWQFIGMLPPSYHYLNRGVSLDRYMLPMVPLAIAIVLWAVRDISLAQPVTWLGIALFAVVSTAGTRDYLVFMDAVWDMGRFANERGVENTKLDAGSGWDGYHLYTYMLDEGITKAKSPPGSPWWVYFYAKPTDSTYIVSTVLRPHRGYIMVAHREYDQWLDDEPGDVYLLRRFNAPWPILDPP
jgi:hypothetical protein